MTTPLFIGNMDHLVKKHKQKCQRRLRTLFPGLSPSAINFSSFDYLNLASHSYVKEQGIAYSLKWGSGPLPSRPLPDYEHALKKTEDLLAKFLGHETVTFYEHDPYLFSKLPSLNDKPLISTHSIVRKTGSLICFDELKQIKESSNSLLAVDDTLSFCMLGTHGFGLSANRPCVDLILGNFNKCFGSYVSYIACSKQLKAQLFDKLPSLHKEQYIPPLFLGMIDATINLLPSMQAERKKLLNLKQLLYTSLRKTPFNPSETKAPFISLPFINPLEMKNLHLHLADSSFIPGLFSSTLSFSPTLKLTEKNITDLFQTFSSYKNLPQFEAL